MPTNFDALPLTATANSVSTAVYFYDGTYGRLIAPSTNVGNLTNTDDTAGSQYSIGSYSTSSTGAAFIDRRYMSTGVGNAHGFADNTYFRRNSYAYAAFDAYTNAGGSGNNFDHIAGFQSRMGFSAGTPSNTMANMYGFLDSPSNSGTLSTRWGIQINDVVNTGTMYASCEPIW
jgi:hypothetical protein